MRTAVTGNTLALSGGGRRGWRGRILALAAAAIGALLLAPVVGSAESPARAAVRTATHVFGTRAELTIVGLPEAAAHERANEVFALLAEMHAQLHAWEPSEVTRLNAAIAAGKPFRVSPRLAAMLREGQRLTTASGRLFDPGIGKLVGLWGFHADEPGGGLPDATSVDALTHARPTLADLDIAADGTVRSRNRAVAVDLGGYAKGWALDECAALLRRRGVSDALIDIGGNLLALGRNGARPWRVGVRDPRGPGMLAAIELRDGEALGTSGDYYRSFETGGVRYAHIIDPRTGAPARASHAATVLTGPAERAGALSDGASKPLFILGPHGALAAAQAMGTERVLIVAAGGEVWTSRAMAARLGRTGARMSLRILHQ